MNKPPYQKIVKEEENAVIKNQELNSPWFQNRCRAINTVKKISYTAIYKFPSYSVSGAFSTFNFKACKSPASFTIRSVISAMVCT